MVTRLKPQRVKTSNTPLAGQNLWYENATSFAWQSAGTAWDMKYADFAWQTLTWNSLTISNISNNITPSSNFTVSAGTVKPWIEYVLRVNSGSTQYTMSLGTGVTNPNGYSTTLRKNTITLFKFIATANNQLELEWTEAIQRWNIEWTLSDQIDLKNALDAKADDTAVVHNTWNETVAWIKTFSSSPVIPAPTNNTDAATKKYVDDQVSAATQWAVSDAAYSASWDGVTGIAPSKNALYDKISAMDTTISWKQWTLIPSTWISIDSSNNISNTLPWPIIAATAPTWTEWALWYDTTNNVLMAHNWTSWKEAWTQMVVLSYGNSTWNDFITAYTDNAVVYCRASSNADPSTWSQWRMAFMAYVNNATSPTEVEFQYYRSVSSHSASQQWDQVFVYKLTNASWWTWTVTTREASSKIAAGTNMTSSYSSWTLTLNASSQVSDTAFWSSWDGVVDVAPSKNAVYDAIWDIETLLANI